MDWALVAFQTVEGAKAALLRAHAVEWEGGANVTTRLLGHTMADARFLFTAIDTDSTGTVSIDEFRAGLHWLGLETARADEMIRLADTDSDGQLGWLEFLRSNGFGTAASEADESKGGAKPTARSR
eukprot:COSAG02_NODE_43045_length_378_cov_1.465950_1_plen_125_part_11